MCNEAKNVCIRFGGILPSKNYLSKTKDVFVEKERLQTIWITDSLDSECQLMTMNAAEDKTWDKAEIVTKVNPTFESTFMCVIPKNVQYKFKQSNNMIKEYRITASGGGMYVFEAVSSYKQLGYNEMTNKIEVWDYGFLKYDGRQYRTPKYYITKIRNPTFIMGRHLWKEDTHMTEQIGNKEMNYAVFSQCADHEFTCTNGFCVNLNFVCDFKYDCEDASDEESCDFVSKPTGHYDKRLSPAIANDGNPTPLTLTVSLDRIVGVMMADSMVEISLTIT